MAEFSFFQLPNNITKLSLTNRIWNIFHLAIGSEANSPPAPLTRIPRKLMVIWILTVISKSIKIIFLCWRPLREWKIDKIWVGDKMEAGAIDMSTCILSALFLLVMYRQCTQLNGNMFCRQSRKRSPKRIIHIHGTPCTRRLPALISLNYGNKNN